MTGLYAARSVVVECLTEGESVINPNVHTHITRPVKEMLMKKRNVINIAVQVIIIYQLYNTKMLTKQLFI